MNKLYQQYMLKFIGIVMMVSLFGCDSNEKILNDVNFRWGDYALFVKGHPKHGSFLVDDEAVLKANRNKIKLKRSASNFLPGEGDRSSGLYLFKNGKLLKRKTGIQFSLFEIGDIAQYAKPILHNRYYNSKANIQTQLELLSKSEEPIYLLNEPEFREHEREFHVLVNLPTVAVPAKKDEQGTPRPVFDANAWKENYGELLKKRAMQRLAPLNDFDLEVASTQTTKAFINDVSFKPSGDDVYEGIPVLHHAGTNSPLLLESYILYHFTLHFSAKKPLIEQLRKMGFSHIVKEEERRVEALTEAVQKLIEQSSKPELAGASEISLRPDFYDQPQIGKIQQYRYTIEWLKVAAQQKSAQEQNLMDPEN